MLGMGPAMPTPEQSKHFENFPEKLQKVRMQAIKLATHSEEIYGNCQNCGTQIANDFKSFEELQEAIQKHFLDNHRCQQVYAMMQFEVGRIAT